jgi:SprT-like family
MSDTAGRRDFEPTNRHFDESNRGKAGGPEPAPIWAAPNGSDWNARPQNGPTQQTYREIQAAFDYLNLELFENKLRCCLITYQRRKGSYGYFAEKRFGREDGEKTNEIALNLQHFAERTIDENLSTLGHEMVHLWQHHFGQPGRGGYHNAQLKPVS